MNWFLEARLYLLLQKIGNIFVVQSIVSSTKLLVKDSLCLLIDMKSSMQILFPEKKLSSFSYCFFRKLGYLQIEHSRK